MGNTIQTSATGEPAALSGYVPQLSIFAQLVYQELVSGRLEWLRLADPEAHKLDDIQYATATELHAYQVKWSNKGTPLTLNEFRLLLPGFVRSWQHLRDAPRARGKRVTAYLLTNRPLSKHDRALSGSDLAGSFKQFYDEAWLPLKAGQPYAAKWEVPLRELGAHAGLNANQLREFAQHFVLLPLYAHQAFSPTYYQRQEAQEVQLYHYFLGQVALPNRQIEFSAAQLLQALGWDPVRTKANHDLVVDQQKYQPPLRTLAALNERLTQLPGGYVFVAGGPGTGKSTLLTQWVRALPERVRVVKYYAFDFTDPTGSWDNTSRRGEALHLLYDLVVQLRTAGFYREPVLPHLDHEFLRGALRRQFGALAEDFASTGRKTLLLIDGLDHVPREYQVIASLLGYLPPPDGLLAGVYVVLGSQSFELPDLRPELRAAWAQGDRRVLMEPLSREEVAGYAAACRLPKSLTLAQQKTLYNKTQGHPLYLAYVCGQLLQANDPDQVLAGADEFKGDLTAYYARIWQPLAAQPALTDLLGLLARVTGPAQPEFISAWGYPQPVLDDLVRQAGPLFQLTAEGWSFFHNSFRQFVLLHTARNPLTEQSDSQADARYHERLATYYQKMGKASQQKPERGGGTGAEQAWNASYHFYLAGKVKKFLRLTTLDCLGQQLLDFRPAAEIRRDIELGLHLARETSDVVLLTRYLFALAELTQRLDSCNPADLVDELLQLGRPDLARRQLRSGNTLRVPEAVALRAVGLFHLAPYLDLAEAALLFRLAEPLAVRPDGLVVDGTEHYAQVHGTLRAWVAAAWHFYPLPDLLARLRHIQLVGGTQQHPDPARTAAQLRLTLLQELAQVAITNQDWTAFSTIQQEFELNNEPACGLLLQLLWQASEHSRLTDDEAGLRAQAAAAQAIFRPSTASPAQRLYVADLLYAATPDLTLVEPWLAGLAPPVVTSSDWPGYERTLDRFRPLLIFTMLRHLQGQPAPDPTASAGPGPQDQLLLEFQRQLIGLAKLRGYGRRGEGSLPGLQDQLLAATHFYYRSPQHQSTSWHSLLQLQGAYFEFLVAAVADWVPESLAELTTYLTGEFLQQAQYWPAAVRRQVLRALYTHGAAIAPLAAALRAGEADLLAGHDVSGRLGECRAQARSWLLLQDHAAAAHWLRRAVRESFGVGYYKDYQFNAWLRWLARLVSVQPAQARARIVWFAAHLKPLQAVTEGRAAQLAAEQLLALTLAWNLSAGRQLLRWLLDQELLPFEPALRLFLAACLPRVQTTEEYDGCLRCYTDLWLFLATELAEDLLQLVLQAGFRLLGESFFTQRVPALLAAINGQALLKNRVPLLVATQVFIARQSSEPTRYDRYFDQLPAQKPVEPRGGNELALRGAGPPYLSEAEVRTRLSTYDELRELLAQEDLGNSHFRWEAVLPHLGSQLSVTQLRALGEATPGGSRPPGFYSVLSELAARAGDRPLAAQLARQSLRLGTKTGWLTAYDGGTRLRALAALRAVEPEAAHQLAFETLTHDAISQEGEWARYYVERLEDILPALAPNLPLPALWEEVFGYLRRLMQTSEPLTQLPDLEPTELTSGEALSSVLADLAQCQALRMQQLARQLLARAVAQGDPAGLAQVIQLAAPAGEGAEAFVEIMLLVPAMVRQGLIAKHQPLYATLSKLTEAPDYWVRRQVRQVLRAAGQPLPPTLPRGLPNFYSTADLPVLANPAGLGMVHAADDLVPYGPWLPLLATHTGLPEATLAARLLALRQAAPAANWSRTNTELANHLWELGLPYSHISPQATATRRALMRLLAELLDAGRLREADIPHLGRFRDYAPAAFPEITRPAFIQHLHQLGYDEQWPHTLHQSERLVTDLPTYSSTELIIGEYTRVRELSWEHKTETYQLQVTLRNDSTAPDDDFIFNIAPDCLTAEYGQLHPSGPSLLLVRTWETGRLGLKAQWLAFNPVVARYLGWQLVPDKLFAWQDQRGNPMVESVYWADGNAELPSKQQNSEAGEGWLVLASPNAWQRLQQLGQPLFLDQRLARARADDDDRQHRAARVVRPLANSS